MTKLIQQGQLRQKLQITTSMQQSLKILQMSSLELNDLVAAELANNPFLEDDNIKEETLVFRDKISDFSINSSSDTDSNYDIFANLENPRNLRTHITEQINTSIHNHRERLIAYYLLDSLQSSGYLTLDINEINAQLKCDHELIERVIKKLQTFDPVGVFARNLKECLQIQLFEKGLLTDSMLLLLDNLALLADGQLKKLEKICSVDSRCLRNMVEELQKLNPKPGNSFLSEETTFKIPDVILTIENNIAKLEVNPASMPKLRLNHEYYLNIKAKSKNKLDRDFANKELHSAGIMLKAIEQRAKTIIRVASAILEEQIEFFTRGLMYLKPLTFRQVAEITNLDESTISRTTANKYISTPSGIYELKYFFSSNLSNAKSLENDVSSTKAQAIIKQIILNEDPNNVLSDDEIVLELKKFNILIARRTVAKYRERVGCATSAIRKRQYKLTNLVK
jgi:RNA polymerase sigma-54 factor